MYKSRLQELCQQKRWSNPNYSSIRDGPDHVPRFKASVVVNGVSFDSTDLCKSSKDAQNEAAKVAFEHFVAPDKASPPPLSLGSSNGSTGMNVNACDKGTPSQNNVEGEIRTTMYKSKLQELCQLKRWSNPNYTSCRDGPDHCSRFKASVLVNGIIFDAPEFCQSAKDAQSEAAKVAYEHFMFPKLPVPEATHPPLPVGSSNASTEMNNSTSGKGPSLQNNPEILQNTSSNGNAPVVKVDKLEDLLHVHKIQLQNYTQKRGLSYPIYTFVREGPPHSVLFKAIVTVDGQTFESPELFRTLKDAEHSAAKVALSSFLKDGNQEEDSSICKNLLQELTLKEGFSTPVYETTRYGPAHAPLFVSTVEVEGDVFHGMEAKTKKQAEMNAAMVAYSSLKQCGLSRIPALLSHNGQAPEAPNCITSCSSSGTVASQQNLKPLHNLISNLSIGSEDKKGGLSKIPALLSHNCQSQEAPKCITSCSSSRTVASQQNLKPLHNLISNPSIGSEEKKDGDWEADSAERTIKTVKADANHSIHSSDMIYARLRDPFPSVTSSPEDEPSSPTTVLQSSSSSEENTRDLPIEPSLLLCNRVRVYPFKPNMNFPEDITVLPISDDKWVAVSLDFPNRESN